MRRDARAIAWFGDRRSVKRYRWTKLKRRTYKIYRDVHFYINGTRMHEWPSIDMLRRPFAIDPGDVYTG